MADKIIQTPLRIVMAQLNMLVGDVSSNVEKIRLAADRARDEFKADVIVFPELAITGYPPEDLLLRPGLHLRILKGLEQLKLSIQGITAIIGLPLQASGSLYNAAVVLQDGQVSAVYHKQLLPNYSVFDEKRYFAPGQDACVVDIKGVPVGIVLCEDIWMPDPVQQSKEAGARLMIIPNASPYHVGRQVEREAMMRQRITESGMPMIYVNLVGGQDELVFDGGSFVMDAQGRVTQRTPLFC